VVHSRSDWPERPSDPPEEGAPPFKEISTLHIIPAPLSARPPPPKKSLAPLEASLLEVASSFLISFVPPDFLFFFRCVPSPSEDGAYLSKIRLNVLLPALVSGEAGPK